MCYCSLGLWRVRSVEFALCFRRAVLKPLPAYLCFLLFSLRAETPSLWTNTCRKTSAPPQNHFYHRARQYTLTKGLKRPGPHASTGHRECTAELTCADAAQISNSELRNLGLKQWWSHDVFFLPIFWTFLTNFSHALGPLWHCVWLCERTHFFQVWC